MPDLTIEIMQQCQSVYFGCASVKWKDQGGCWPYKKNGTCKHICGWHEIVGDPVQSEVQAEQMICPKCLGKTEYVRVGV